MTFFRTHTRFAQLFRRTPTSSGATEFGRDARFDWKALCLSFLVLLLCAITLSIVVYDRVEKENLFLTSEKEPISTPSFDKRKLEHTVLFFEKKQEQFDALKRRPLPTIDPYIPRLQAK